MKTSLCTVSFSVIGFQNDWKHCDQIAEYLAAATTIDKPEPFRCSNLLSRIINEILETLRHSDRPESSVEVEILTDAPLVYVVIHVDPTDRIVKLYNEIVKRTAEGGSEELYQGCLTSAERRPEIGILGLVCQYQASVNVQSSPSGRAAIEVSVALDRLLEVAQ